jgi:hypothetical protein
MKQSGAFPRADRGGVMKECEVCGKLYDPPDFSKVPPWEFEYSDCPNCNECYALQEEIEHWNGENWDGENW